MKRFQSPYSSFTPSSSDYREYPTPISGYTDEGDHVFLSFLGLSSDDLQKAGDTIKKATNVAQTAQSLYNTVKSGSTKTASTKTPVNTGQAATEEQSWWTTKRIAIVGAVTVTVLVATLFVIKKLKGK